MENDLEISVMEDEAFLDIKVEFVLKAGQDDIQWRLTQQVTATSVSASKFLLDQHSGVFRNILRQWPHRDRHVQECDTPEEMEVGKLVVEMIMNFARPSCSKRDAEFLGMPPTKLIKCMIFSDYWDAPSCVEYCMDCLTKICHTPPSGWASFSQADIEALLAAPGSVLIKTELKHKVEDVCCWWLLREYGENWRGVLANDAQKRGLHSLSIPAAQLLYRTTGSPELLASWYSGRAQVSVVQDADWQALLDEISCEDAHVMARPTSGGGSGIGLCSNWLLFHYGDVHEVISDKRLLSSFCSLSFFLVRVWARLDALAVSSENDVVVLLSYYCAQLPSVTSDVSDFDGGEEVAVVEGEGGGEEEEEVAVVGDEGGGDEEEEGEDEEEREEKEREEKEREEVEEMEQYHHTELSNAIRVRWLTPSFRFLILPQLPWFRPKVALNAFNAAWDTDRSGMEKSPRLRAQLSVPDSWVASPRCGPLPQDAARRSVLEHAPLKHRLACGVKLSAPPVYFHGFYWEVCAQFLKSKQSFIAELRIVDCPIFQLPEALAVKLRMTVAVQQVGSKLCSAWLQRGKSGEAGCRHTLALERLDEALVDNKIHVAFELHAVS
ncbi:hypothetical protein DUNSADRAFT_9466 [Dunaliella salina]|uniref:BTB domain-containing protein n=1 Tax=Dunaliella salina TaxID=3046 RepID=A0ABQ7GHF5_DUNSA|nr:hypothetical protein DUNSADRAFT_9466 [Dunaliella salina]|eukprot:KAF5834027.1 hypothetical protein DUNSADRAFT_9466 [Dunaliella salina]